jgi:acetaldehyde dehydrogenase
MAKTKVAIIGSGNIGTDLMFKVIRLSETLQMGAMVGIDPDSDGLARAGGLGIPTTSDGVAGLIAMPDFSEIEVIFDATSAGAHKLNAEALEPYDKVLVDMTPAAIGAFVVPVANLDQHIGARNVNMVTCGGQATIPIVHAVSSMTPVHYAEIVASIASKSAGPGTRASIDEFTETTGSAIEQVGGAARGKAIIVLNPAEPPVVMRDTVQIITGRLDVTARKALTESVETRVAAVAGYVTGYRLKQPVQFEDHGVELDLLVPEDRREREYTKVSVYLEVEGAAMYLPAYAGNLDIMTSAALHTAERLISARKAAVV